MKLLIAIGGAGREISRLFAESLTTRVVLPSVLPCTSAGPSSSHIATYVDGSGYYMPSAMKVPEMSCDWECRLCYPLSWLLKHRPMGVTEQSMVALLRVSREAVVKQLMVDKLAKESIEAARNWGPVWWPKLNLHAPTERRHAVFVTMGAGKSYVTATLIVRMLSCGELDTADSDKAWSTALPGVSSLRKGMFADSLGRLAPPSVHTLYVGGQGSGVVGTYCLEGNHRLLSLSRNRRMEQESFASWSTWHAQEVLPKSSSWIRNSWPGWILARGEESLRGRSTRQKRIRGRGQCTGYAQGQSNSARRNQSTADMRGARGGRVMITEGTASRWRSTSVEGTALTTHETRMSMSQGGASLRRQYGIQRERAPSDRFKRDEAHRGGVVIRSGTLTRSMIPAVC
jgi:hypothetical protein